MSKARLPKVSVVVLTYNHERFICQALDSVLMQEVDFSYEIIVGEDCSTDGTRAIVAEYAQRFPNVVKPIFQAHNMGMGGNLKACLAACQGEYLAPLEGDDYWTSPQKLQLQVDFLAANPDYSMCFHQVEVLRTTPAVAPELSASSAELTFERIAANLVVAPVTNSLLLRNCIDRLPDWLFTVNPIDYPLILLYAEQGRAQLLPGIMSVYRVHAGGIWSGASQLINAQRSTHMHEQVAQHYAGTKHSAVLYQTLYKSYLNTADKSIQYGLGHESPRFIRKAIRLWPASNMTNLKSLAGVTSRWLLSYLRPGAATASTQPTSR